MTFILYDVFPSTLLPSSCSLFLSSHFLYSAVNHSLFPFPLFSHKLDSSLFLSLSLSFFLSLLLTLSPHSLPPIYLSVNLFFPVSLSPVSSFVNIFLFSCLLLYHLFFGDLHFTLSLFECFTPVTWLFTGV